MATTAYREGDIIFERKSSTPRTDTKQVIHNILTLEQLPDAFANITIQGFTQVFNQRDITATTFYVHPKSHKVEFHPSQDGKSFTVNYNGIGRELIPQSMIYTDIDNTGAVKTLDTITAEAKILIPQARDTVETVKRLESVVAEGKTLHGNLVIANDTATTKNTTLNATINTANDVLNNIERKGNKTFNILSSNWTWVAPANRYEYTLNHGLNTRALVFHFYNATEDFITLGGRLLDLNNVIFYNNKQEDVRVVITINYQGIFSNLQGFNTNDLLESTTKKFITPEEKTDISNAKTEVQNARQGKATLVENLINIKASIADKQTQINQIPNQSYITEKAKIIDVNNALATKANQSDLNNTNNTLATKADKSYVDSVTQSIASGSPKAVFATLANLQADTTANTVEGKKSIYLVHADGNWYYWNGTAWTSGGVYQSTIIADESIVDRKVAQGIDSDKLRRVIDSKDSSIIYKGTWLTESKTEYYKGNAQYSNNNNDTIEFSFIGTGVGISACKRNDLGMAEIFIDGVSRGTIDTYSYSPIYKTIVYSITDLAYSMHTVKIRVTGTKNINATDSWFMFDYCEVYGDRVSHQSSIDLLNNRLGLAPVTVIDDSNGDITYIGGWSDSYHGAEYYNNTRHISNITNDYIEYDFEGTGISVYGHKGNDCGMVEVILNGVSQGAVDLYNPTSLDQNLLYNVNNLIYKKHNIKLKITGNKHASSTGTYFPFDYFEVFNKKLKTDYFINVKSFGAIGNGVSDDTNAIQRAINLAASCGGEVYFPTGTYLITGQLTVPNYSGRQKPVKLIGAGAYMDGQGLGINGGTVLDLRYTGSYGKLLTLGVGLLEIEGITFTDNSGGNTPFIYTTYTTLHIRRNSFIGTKEGVLCDQDCIILGGTKEIEYRNQVSPEYGFQGYGTIIKDNYFNHIRRAVYGRVFANATVVQNNNIWNGCGSNLVGGCAIEFDDCAVNPVQWDAGGMISGNLIEMCHYTYGVKFLNARFFTLLANNLYDAGSGTSAVAGVYFGAASKFNYLLTGYNSYQYGNMAEYKDDSDGSNMIVSPLSGIKTNSKIQCNEISLKDSVGIYSGLGSPEGVVTAKIGSMYTRTDGGAKTTLYIKESGTGNTGWVAK